MRNVIITGVPRAGTTLASALFDGILDCVCLNEPDWQTASFSTNPMNYAKWLVGDFVRTRHRLVTCDPIPDRRAPDKSAVTNYYLHDKETNTNKTNYETVRFTRPGLQPNFNLAIKHNGPYLGALPSLVELRWFYIIAIIRHPIPVIHSWRSLDLPISRGLMPNATGYWPEMAQLTATPMDLLEKQVRMYDLMCQRMYEVREGIAILPYEALVQDPQIIANAIHMPDAKVPAHLVGKPSREVPEQDHALISDALEKYGQYWKYFYPSGLDIDG